jgi:hypothetical protein
MVVDGNNDGFMNFEYENFVYNVCARCAFSAGPTIIAIPSVRGDGRAGGAALMLRNPF